MKEKKIIRKLNKIFRKEYLERRRTIKQLQKEVKFLMETERIYNIDNSKLIDDICRKIVFLEGL